MKYLRGFNYTDKRNVAAYVLAKVRVKCLLQNTRDLEYIFTLTVDYLSK